MSRLYFFRFAGRMLVTSQELSIHRSCVWFSSTHPKTEKVSLRAVKNYTRNYRRINSCVDSLIPDVSGLTIKQCGESFDEIHT